MPKDFIGLLADLEEEEVIKLTRQRLENGDEALAILEDSRKAMELVGNRFAEGEYFIPELVYSGELLKQITELVKPHLVQSGDTKTLGKVVIGTVAGDIHDIGLNIVEFMLNVNGFQVYNLGVDVPVDKFVQAMKETSAPVLGLSGFLTLAFDSMKDTVEALETAGIRGKMKVMIGGGQMDDEVMKYARADAYGKDAMAAVALAKKWIGGN
ncbi:MAG: cobalamin-dependent protein [Dehalococcoidia bacterium]|jgi:5-methyltetrahydrofolate--homocysteine methyltransferase